MRRKNESPVVAHEIPSQPILLAIIASLLAVIACLIGLMALLLCHQFADSQHQQQQQPHQLAISSGSFATLTLGPPSAAVNLSQLYIAALSEIVGEDARKRDLLVQLAKTNCHRRYRHLRPLGVGWSKATHLAVDTDTGETLAMKRPHQGGHDMTECLRQPQSDIDGCYKKLAGKFMRELVFLQLMNNTDGIIQLKGWCLSPDDFYVATEVGAPLEIVSLLQMSWEDRLRIATDVSEMLYSLHASPVGSLALRDFRRGQFARSAVDGRLKLIDLDDLDRALPQCSQPDGLCSEKVDRSSYVRTRCQRDACPGHNDRVNLHRARAQFYNFLLQHGAPPGLDGAVRALRGGLDGGRVAGSRSLRDAVWRLVQRYSAGDYQLLPPQRDSGSGGAAPTAASGAPTLVDGRDASDATAASSYHLVANSSVTGSDYPCRYTISGPQCLVSATSLEEARLLCAWEPACKGFVVTPSKSWTNRTVIVLKSGVDRLVKAEGHQLYLRRR